jgi:hypothetical protein
MNITENYVRVRYHLLGRINRMRKNYTYLITKRKMEGKNRYLQRGNFLSWVDRLKEASGYNFWIYISLSTG